MKKGRILKLFFIVCNLAFSEDTVLVPTNNGNYIRVPVSQVTASDTREKIEEIKNKQKENEKTAEISERRDDIIPISENTIFDDMLEISLNYDYRKIDRDSLHSNENPLQNKVAEDFIENSKTTTRVYEDMYLFDINTFGSKTKFEDMDNEEFKNYGIVTSLQYGITNDINIKFNAGYSKSEFLNDKTNNMYFSLDYSYSPYYDNENETIWELGAILGYLNGKNDYYKTEDMFIALIYTNILIPVTESVFIDGSYESTILSNKIELGLRKNIYFFENIDIGLKISSDYVFSYDDKDKRIFTHLDNDKSTIKLETEFSEIFENGFSLKSYYDFKYESYGVILEYKF